MSVGGDPGFALAREPCTGGVIASLTIIGRTAINVVGRELLERGAGVLRSLGADAAIRCLVLRGPTPRAFIGGADLRELERLDEHSAAPFILAIHEFCEAIRDFPVPVIAVIRGVCLGAGLEIAAACDLRIGDTTAQCGMPEVQVGLPSVVEAAMLPLLIGWGRTRELVYRGHIIDATEAGRIGLIDPVVAVDALDAAVGATTGDIASAAPRAIRLQKRLIRTWESAPLEAAIAAGVGVFAEACGGDEPRQYIGRFFARHAGGAR